MRLEDLDRRAKRGDYAAAEEYARLLIASGDYVKYLGAPNLAHAVARAAWDAGRFHGELVLTESVLVFEDGDSSDVFADPPLLMRVDIAGSPSDDVERLMGDGWVDPLWAAEPVHPRLEIEGTSSVWVNAPCYCDMGRDSGRVQSLNLWVPKRLAGDWRR